MALVALAGARTSWALPGDVSDTAALGLTAASGAAVGDGKLWVADRKDATITAFDLVTKDKVLAWQAPGDTPTGLAWADGYLWVSDDTAKKAYRIEAATGLVVHEIDLPGGQPADLAWDGTHLWVADASKKKRIRMLDPMDGTTIQSFRAPYKSATGLAWGGSLLWSADRIADELYGIDPTSGNVVVVLSGPGEHLSGLAMLDDELLAVDMAKGEVHTVIVKDDAVTEPRLGKGTKRTVELTATIANQGPNPLASATVYVALPSSLPSQTLLGEPVFSTSPTSIIEEPWGSELAVFDLGSLAPAGVATVSASFTAELRSATWTIFPDEVGTLADIPEAIRMEYLQDAGKYLVKDPYVIKLVKKLLGKQHLAKIGGLVPEGTKLGIKPGKSAKQKAKKGKKSKSAASPSAYHVMRTIYDYVIDTMSYELSGGWNTAPKVLARKTGSCSEYTFAFIALARAAGLPARYVGSLVVRKDDVSFDEVYHRWVEVYLPGYGWIPVDANAGDKDYPRDQALGIGHLDGVFLVTTQGGGGPSDSLGWGYNSNATWTYKGKAKVTHTTSAFWTLVQGGTP